MKKSNKAKLSRYLMARQKQFFSVKENAPKITEKGVAIAALIDGKFGCQTESVKKLVEGITGEKLPSATASKGIRKRAIMFVPLLGIHDEKNVMVPAGLRKDYVLTGKGEEQACPLILRENIKAPTEKQVKAFVNGLSEEVINKYFGFVLA